MFSKGGFFMLFAIGVIGAVIGSFVNVVSVRRSEERRVGKEC